MATILTIAPTKIALPDVEESPEHMQAPEELTCYVLLPDGTQCGRPHYTECEACERVICKQHTKEYMTPCIALRTHCPLCWGKKQRGEV